MNRTLERSLQVDSPIALSLIRQETEGIGAILALKWLKSPRRPYLWMLLPALLLLTVFFLLPIVNMIKYSFYTQVGEGEAFIVYLQNQQMSHTCGPLHVGDTVHLSWKPEHALVVENHEQDGNTVTTKESA